MSNGRKIGSGAINGLAKILKFQRWRLTQSILENNLNKWSDALGSCWELKNILNVRVTDCLLLGGLFICGFQLKPFNFYSLPLVTFLISG